jgi:hypothetical protein
MKRKMSRNQGAPYVSDTTGKNIPVHEAGSPFKYKGANDGHFYKQENLIFLIAFGI